MHYHYIVIIVAFSYGVILIFIICSFILSLQHSVFYKYTDRLTVTLQIWQKMAIVCVSNHCRRCAVRKYIYSERNR